MSDWKLMVKLLDVTEMFWPAITGPDKVDAPSRRIFVVLTIGPVITLG